MSTASKAMVLMVCSALASCGLGGRSGRDDFAAAIASKDYRAATVIGKTLVERYPGDASIRLNLAIAQVEVQDFDGAMAQLDAAERAGLDISQTGPVRAQALLGQGRFEDALSLASRSELSQMNTAAMARVRGFALLALNRLDEARSAFVAAVGAEPTHVATVLGLATSIELAEGPTAAMPTVEAALSLEPKNLLLQFARGDLQLRAGQLSQARATYNAAASAAKSYGDDEAYAFGLQLSGAAALLARDNAGARSILAQLREMKFALNQAMILESRIAIAEGNQDAAEQKLRETIERFPEDLTARMLSATLALQRGQHSVAREQLNAIVAADPRNANARRMLAQLALFEGKAEEAQAIATAGIDSADPQLLALGARASLALGDRERAEEFLRSNRSGASSSIAEAMLLLGRFEAAVDLLRTSTAKGVERNHQRLLLISALVGSKRLEEARREANAIAAGATQDVRGLLLVARAQALAKNHAAARLALDVLRKQTVQDANAWVAIGAIERELGEPSRADEAFAAALAIAPGNDTAHLGRAFISIDAGNTPRAITLLEAGRQGAPKSLPVRTLLAKLLISESRVTEAEPVLAEAMALDSKHPEVRELSAAIAQVNGNYPTAIVELEALTRDFPNAPTLRSELARAYLGAKRFADAERAATEALRLDPGSRRAAAVLASVRRSVPAPGAGSAGAAAPSNAATRAAIDAFQARHRKGDANAAATLRARLAEAPADVAARVMLAQYLEERKDPSAADEYERVLATDPNNLVALNNLAWIRLGQQRLRPALSLARRAYAVAPFVPPVADTLGWVLVATGAPQEAVPILERAHAAAPEERSIRYHLAVALARSGAHQRALVHLDELVGENVAFEEAAEARELQAELRKANPS